jgi:hypothetical protein
MQVIFKPIVGYSASDVPPAEAFVVDPGAFLHVRRKIGSVSGAAKAARDRGVQLMGSTSPGKERPSATSPDITSGRGWRESFGIWNDCAPGGHPRKNAEKYVPQLCPEICVLI